MCFPSSAASTAVWSMYSSPRSCGRRSTFRVFPFLDVFSISKESIASAPPPTRAQSSAVVFAAASASACAAAASAATSASSSSESGDPSPFLPASKNLRGPERIRASVWRCRGIRERHRRRDGRARGESFQLERRRRPRSYIAFTLMDIRSERWCFLNGNNPRPADGREGAGVEPNCAAAEVRDLTESTYAPPPSTSQLGASPPRSPRSLATAPGTATCTKNSADVSSSFMDSCESTNVRFVSVCW